MSDGAWAYPVNSNVPKSSCILNGKSAHAERARVLIARIANELGVESEVTVTRSADELTALARRAVSSSDSRIAAGGGDGTVNAVASAVAGTSTALGVLPMGTLNHFAKDVGIPLDLEQAVRTFFTGAVVQVDVGEVNGRVFVNNSGMGVYPHIVREREAQQRHGHRKPLAFVIAVGAVLRRYARLRIRLHLSDAEALAKLTPFLFVGNNRYQIAGLEIGRRLSLSSGRLWVLTAPRATRSNLIRMAWRTFIGRISDQELSATELQEFWVDPGTPRINISLDGEVTLMTAPLHYRSRPGALSVVLPAARI